MIRIKIELDSDNDFSASQALRAMAEKIEDGQEAGTYQDADTPEGKFAVTKLCELCNGTGIITEGQHDDIITKKCICNQPDYESQRD